MRHVVGMVVWAPGDDDVVRGTSDWETCLLLWRVNPCPH